MPDNFTIADRFRNQDTAIPDQNTQFDTDLSKQENSSLLLTPQTFATKCSPTLQDITLADDKQKLEESALENSQLLADQLGMQYSGFPIRLDIQAEIHRSQDSETVSQIAKTKLGATATPTQLAQYIEEIRWLNFLLTPKLEGDDDPIPEGLEIQLPGHRPDGGLVTQTHNEGRQISYSDGTVMREDPLGSLLRLPDGSVLAVDAGIADLTHGEDYISLEHEGKIETWQFNSGSNQARSTSPQGGQRNTSIAYFHLPTMDSVDFSDRLYDKWIQLDTNLDDRISLTEVDSAVVSSNFTASDSVMLSTLKTFYSELAALDGGWFGLDSFGGVTKNDLETLTENKFDLTLERDFAAQSEQYIVNTLGDLDTNCDSMLDKDELNAAINDQLRSGQEKLYLEYVSDHFSDLGGSWITSGGRINVEHLKQISDVPNLTLNSILDQQLEDALNRYTRSIETTNPALFATNDPVDSIVPTAVLQGNIGDCSFLAAVAALAASDPESIKEMIQENDDGTYTVSFPGADRRITVNAPSESELELYAHGNKFGIWVPILEKAFGEYRTEINKHYDTIISAEAAGPTSLAEALQILTGANIKEQLIATIDRSSLETMLNNIDEGYPLTVDVQYNPINARGGDLLTGHAYGVIGYDQQAQVVTIREPNGVVERVDDQGYVRDGIFDGVFTVSLDEFYERFSFITVHSQ